MMMIPISMIIVMIMEVLQLEVIVKGKIIDYRWLNKCNPSQRKANCSSMNVLHILTIYVYPHIFKDGLRTFNVQ